VLARLFNEASGQKAPSKKHGLFISRPLHLIHRQIRFNAFCTVCAADLPYNHRHLRGSAILRA
jgi:hypothetical protein